MLLSIHLMIFFYYHEHEEGGVWWWGHTSADETTVDQYLNVFSYAFSRIDSVSRVTGDGIRSEVIKA